MACCSGPIFLDQADIVVGSRHLGKGSCVPGTRLLGHRLFNLLTWLASGVKVSDSQCGYRAFSARALEKLCFCAQGFAVESEIQFLAQAMNWEVEISCFIQTLPRPWLFHAAGAKR
jgi:hypothetical protein